MRGGVLLSYRQKGGGKKKKGKKGGKGGGARKEVQFLFQLQLKRTGKRGGRKRECRNRCTTPKWKEKKKKKRGKGKKGKDWHIDYFPFRHHLGRTDKEKKERKGGEAGVIVFLTHRKREEKGGKRMTWGQRSATTFWRGEGGKGGKGKGGGEKKASSFPLVGDGKS